MITHLTTGVHELPRKSDHRGKLNEMRCAMCVAYYVFPRAWRQRSLVRWTTGPRIMSSSRLKFSCTFAKYFLWPPSFGDQGGESSCFSHRKDFGTDLYCRIGMREAAQGLNRAALPVGCAAFEFFRSADPPITADPEQSTIDPRGS